MRSIGTARIIVACSVALVGTAAVAIPVGIYFNTSRSVQYENREIAQDVDYNSPLPSPPTVSDDYLIPPTLLDKDYMPGDEIGAEGRYVIWQFKPKPTSSKPILRYTVKLTIVKAKVKSSAKTASDSFVRGGTVFPLKADADIPAPPVGYKRPWVRVGDYISGLNGKPVSQESLPKLPAGTTFTATYEANLDDSRYRPDPDDEGFKADGAVKATYVITYTIVQPSGS